MAPCGWISSCRTHRQSDQKTSGGSDALARWALNWGWLGLRPKRSARSSGRDDRPVAYRPDPFPKRRVPNRFWCIAHSGAALSGHLNRGAVLAPSPTGTRGIVDPACYDALSDAALLDLSRRGALIAAGFTDFALIGFHFQKAHAVPTNLIPVFYAVGMATSALAVLLFGRLFDKFGGNIALLAFFISAASAPFVFLGTSFFALIGMILWGIGMSAQGPLLQAMLTGVIPAEKRSTAFGLFDTGY